MRTAWEKSVRFPFALQDHWIFRKVCLLAAKVLDFAFVLFSQVVKPQTIPLRIHELAELILQTAALSRVQQTLKHGILHPLTVVDTLLGDLPQTPAPSGIFCIDIISTHSPFVLLLVDQADKDYVHKYNQLLLKEEDNEYFLHL